MPAFVVTLISEASEALPAMIACKRSISSVRPEVDFQISHFREPLSTMWKRTYVFSPGTSLVLVDLMNSKSVFANEALRAVAALEYHSARWQCLNYLLFKLSMAIV